MEASPVGFMGRYGTKEHEDIVNWMRFDVAAYLRKIFFDTEWSFIYDENLIAILLGTYGDKYRRGGYYPDGLIIYENGEERAAIIVEVGNYNLSKALPGFQILHVGFDKDINIVNPQNEFTSEVVEMIQELVILEAQKASRFVEEQFCAQCGCLKDCQLVRRDDGEWQYCCAECEN